MTSSIVAFLTARYDELEADVQDSRGLSPGDLHWSMPDWLDRNYLLADIASKRQTLAGYRDALRRADEFARLPVPSGPIVRLIHEAERTEVIIAVRTWDKAVKLLAAPFAQHPEFDPSWAVE